MKIIRIAVIVFMGILLMAGASCGGGENAEPTATPIVTATPTPLPTVVMSCDQARDAIQEALIDYHNERGEWPTANGEPGDIEWINLVPDFMTGIPSNDSKCEWWVNSDPKGDVCLQNIC